MGVRVVFVVALLVAGFLLQGVGGFVHRVGADGGVVVISSLPFTVSEPGVYVLESDLASSGDGIVVEASDVVILGNGHTISGSSGYDGIDIVLGRNVTVRGLRIEGFSKGINVRYNSSSGLVEYSGVVLEDLYINASSEGIYIDLDEESLYNIIIRNTTITGASTHGIYIYETYGVTIRDVEILGNGTMDYGIYVDEYSEGVYIYNATIRDVEEDGIYMYYVGEEYGGAAIVESTIINPGDDAIYLDSCEYVTIQRNNITGGEFGIYLDYSSHIYIRDNYISSTTADTAIEIAYSSNDVYVEGNIIANNSGSGIKIYDAGSHVYIYSNQILWNGGYGVEADTRNTFNVSGNTIAGNTESPQAYDNWGTGNWTGNYWSDYGGGGAYTFTSNEDPSPLATPSFDLVAGEIRAPPVIEESPAHIRAYIANLGYGEAVDVPVTLYWSEPPSFTQTEYTWINVDPESAEPISNGDVAEDYGNYTLTEEDDGYFVYKLPWPIQVYGHNYTYIAVSTNGYVELLESNSSVLEGEYNVHDYGYHRTWEGGVTTIFACQGDLTTEDDGEGGYVAVYNLGDKVVVRFHGSSYDDWDVASNPIDYEIILYRSGEVTISIDRMEYYDYNGDGFTGMYVKELGAEITAAYMPRPHTSYTINPVLHEADSNTTSLAPGEGRWIDFEWDTSSLPHYSPYTLWVHANTEGTGETSTTNTPTTITIEVLPPPSGVGGVLVDTSEQADTETIILAAITAITTIAVLVVKRAK